LMLQLHFAATTEEMFRLLESAIQTMPEDDPEMIRVWRKYASELILAALRDDNPNLFIASKVALMKASLLGSSSDLNWTKYRWIAHNYEISCNAWVEEAGEPEQVLKIVELLRD